MKIMALNMVACLLACSGRAPGGYSREQLLEPQTCAQCHPDHFRDWSRSMHAHASDDPVFVAMNQRAQREAQVGSFCIACHAPLAVRQGLSNDGLNLDTLPASSKGVTCFFCHTTDRIDGTHNNPLHLADGLSMRGSLHDPVDNPAHDSVYSMLHDRDLATSSDLCGSCHDVVSPHGAAIERTFLEWQGSVFAQPDGATCGQCHMDQSVQPMAIARGSHVPLRRYHSHAFVGVHVLHDGAQDVASFLDTTLQSALCVAQPNGGSAGIRVIVDNVAAGHGFPSGAAQDRRLWFEVNVYKDDRLLHHDVWRINDCMFDAAGHRTHMFWEAASYQSNTLPAAGSVANHVVQSFPRVGFLPEVPDRVTLQIRLQAIGRDVLDDLVRSGDLSPDFTTPTYDLGAPLEWTAGTAKQRYVERGIYPVSCVTLTNLNVAAPSSPAPKGCDEP